jgi:murein DD-endopeptidase MepM/ murein hydrolase activator NlpD
MFGGGRFQDFSRHPDVVVSTKGFPKGSAAAGRYQFMPGTYAGAQKALGLQGFGPQEQDLAAIYLMKQRGVDPTKDPITPQTIAKLAPEWASLPTLQGKSFYGQPVKSLGELQGFLQKPSGGVPYQVKQAAGVTPVSLPRYDFQGALKNIVTQYALSGAAQSTGGDTQKAQVYLQAAEAIKADPDKYGEEGRALAEQYQYKANEVMFLGGAPGGNDPSKLVMDILGAKMSQKEYDKSQATQESLINSQLSSFVTPGAPSSTPSSFEKPASVVYEQPSGQPGVDLYFSSKRFPAVLGGVVKDIGREGGYGNYVVVESLDPLTNKKVDVLYGHLADNSLAVRPGQQIAPGQIIGQQGGTGNVRSADGTIASVDFLAPRGAGSRDMTPYSNFDQLRRYVVSNFQGGAGR